MDLVRFDPFALVCDLDGGQDIFASLFYYRDIDDASCRVTNDDAVDRLQ